MRSGNFYQNQTHKKKLEEISPKIAQKSNTKNNLLMEISTKNVPFEKKTFF
jgi:hypothetical protein